ncbi:LysR family transcriptional regulator [Clostridium sp. HCP1S3_B4]|uniref:LysR family transcriptional regulator n=1 Tax=unclassified Clostridium TaxID=2614128 RepID=UPI00169AB4D9|nr:LysR family transcriptional regulator [Clostridiales bacterium]MDY2729462.1 LysR family transcriptional regulator [Clostridium sp.]NLK23925.1 LysR family transcriptional regulator [Clostridiales bacterium]
MTLQQIKYVIAIANTNSMNEAAKNLFVSQPSLSSAIKELEDELQITIFSRTNKGVVITQEGEEFLIYAKQILDQVELLEEKYINHDIKKKFGVSTQHYSFAVKAFVEMVKDFDMNKYEFAIRETRTNSILEDVKNGKSEIGILYINDFNEKVIHKLLKSNELQFEELIKCKGYVYLWKDHPLAKNKIITMKELEDYPCLAFEQGENNSFYFAEEILSTYNYPKIIKACDRATMLNLMVGLNGYTLCSGIICEELNGSDYRAVPLETEQIMKIGYITRKNSVISNIGKMYIDEIKKYLSKCINL